MSIEFGIYPLTGILVAGLLYGVYRLFIRMHCNPRIAQRYIMAVVMVSLMVSFVQPMQYEEQKSFFEQHSSGGSHSESKEPLIVVDGTVMGNAPEAPHGKSNDDDQQLSTLLGINEDDISSVTVLQGSASAAIYGLEGKNGVIEVTTKKSSQPIGILTPKATKMMRYIYLIGLCTMLIYILIQMLWLIRVRRRSTHMAMEGGVRVYDSDIPTPFSFGNSVFIPNEIEGHLREDILVHEREHLRHRHYMKLCMMQLLQSFGWFNPFIWLFSSEQKLQQEMEVDCAVINTGRNREQYQMNLLRICLHGNKWVQIMPAFGSSIVKQRILFMNRWKPTRNASFRLVAAVLAALLIFGSTAYAFRKTTKEQSPFDGCWTMDWFRETNSLIENVPSLAGNMFYGNDMMFNFSWFGRYNGVNMRFNFSGEPQYYRNGKIYDYRGKEMNLKLTDSNTFQKRWTRTPQMTALVSGNSNNITEQWRRTEPDKDVLHIIHAFATAGTDKSHPVCGVWKETPDTIPYQDNFFLVNGDIYARFTIYSDPKGYYCSAGGWCGDAHHEADDKLFMSDRTSAITWHNNDSITLTIPRDSNRLEPHIYKRSELPVTFLKLLKAAKI